MDNHPEQFQAVGTLFVNNLDKTKDAGFYQCLVKDKSDTGNSATLNVIKILGIVLVSNTLNITIDVPIHFEEFKFCLFLPAGANESFINITEPSGKYNSELSANQKEAKWYVKYSGHPTPTLMWRDVQGREIPWSNDDGSNPNRKYEATQDKRSTTLKIRNPQIGDSGYYTLYASNGQIQKEQKFQLLVKGKIRKRL